MGPNVTTGLRKPAARNKKTRQCQNPDFSWPVLSDCLPSLRTTLSYAGNFVWTGWEERSSRLFLRFLLELRSPRKRQKSARSPPAVLGSVYCTLESCSALTTNGSQSEKLPGVTRANGCVGSLAQLTRMLPTLKDITQQRQSQQRTANSASALMTNIEPACGLCCQHGPGEDAATCFCWG